jgi:hypothetical protein
MIRHGQTQCGSCHVDPSGGETLTGWGRSAASSLLRGDSSADPVRFLFGVDEPRAARLGGSVRVLSVTDLGEGHTDAFPMQADFYGVLRLGSVSLGGSIGASRTSPTREHTEKALLLGDAGQRAAALVSRTHWLGFRPTDHVLIRAGRLNLPFGLRVAEHTLWVRSETLTDRESDQQHGLSWAYTEGNWRTELMAVAGNFQVANDDFRERGYSGHVEYRWSEGTAVGASGLTLSSARELRGLNRRVVRHAWGLTLRKVLFEDAVLLGELDLLKKTGRGLGHVGLLTVDYEPLRALHLALTLEALRGGAVESDDVGGPGRTGTRLGGWATVNWFFFEHFDARLDFVARQDRSLQLLAQLHCFL